MSAQDNFFTVSSVLVGFQTTIKAKPMRGSDKCVLSGLVLFAPRAKLQLHFSELSFASIAIILTATPARDDFRV